MECIGAEMGPEENIWKVKYLEFVFHICSHFTDLFFTSTYGLFESLIILKQILNYAQLEDLIFI